MEKIIFFLAIFITYFLPPIDTDLGWHLRYGNYFLDHGYPMMKNKLTVLLHNQSWPNSYTFYQPTIAGINRLFGFWGLSLLNSLILTFSFYFLWLLFDKNLIKTSVAALITGFGGWTILRYGLRGQVTSLLFLAMLFYILEKINQIKVKSILLGLLFLIWANLHGSYLYGILLTWLSSLSKLQLIPLIPTIFAPLLNPYGIGNYKHVLITMTSPLNKMIAEWTPPQPIYKIIAIGLFLFYLSLWWKKRKKLTLTKLSWPLATLSGLYLLFNARRNLPQYFFIQSIALLKLVDLKKSSFPLLKIFWSSVIFLSLILITPKTIKLNSDQETFCKEGMTHYPCQAIAYIKENNLKGNIFNFYRWGGFLTWQLPNNLAFVAGHIPGRPTDSGEYPYQIHLEILQAQPGYQEKLDKYNIDYILIPPKTFLDLELQKEDKAPWQEIYRDKISVLYKRKNTDEKIH